MSNHKTILKSDGFCNNSLQGSHDTVVHYLKIKHETPSKSISNDFFSCVVASAFEISNLEAIEYLFKEQNSNKNSEFIKSLPLVCYRGNLDVVRCVINEIKPSLLDKDVHSFFHRACSGGHREMIDYFLFQSGLNCLKQKQGHGAFPKQHGIIGAIEGGHLDILKYLLSFKISKHHNSVDFMDYDGRTCLHIACENRQLNIVKYLTTSPELDKHCDIYYRDGQAFYEAVKRNSETIRDFFLFDLNFQVSEQLDKKLHTYFLMYENIERYHELRTLIEKRDNFLHLQNQIKSKNKGTSVIKI